MTDHQNDPKSIEQLTDEYKEAVSILAAQYPFHREADYRHTELGKLRQATILAAAAAFDTEHMAEYEQIESETNAYDRIEKEARAAWLAVFQATPEADRAKSAPDMVVQITEHHKAAVIDQAALVAWCEQYHAGFVEKAISKKGMQAIEKGVIVAPAEAVTITTEYRTRVNPDRLPYIDPYYEETTEAAPEEDQSNG